MSVIGDGNFYPFSVIQLHSRCGGSGAKTLAFIMDQLKAELRTIDPDITELPKAWQFVNIATS